MICSLEMDGQGNAAGRILECTLQNQERVLIFCSHVPMIQKG